MPYPLDGTFTYRTCRKRSFSLLCPDSPPPPHHHRDQAGGEKEGSTRLGDDRKLGAHGRAGEEGEAGVTKVRAWSSNAIEIAAGVVPPGSSITLVMMADGSPTQSRSARP